MIEVMRVIGLVFCGLIGAFAILLILGTMMGGKVDEEVERMLEQRRVR